MFKDSLIVEKQLDGKNWKIVKGFTYTTSCDVDICVPDGFETDFASIPRGLWNIFPPTGRYGHAAVIHDFLYRNTDVPRERCDKIFLEAMKELKVNRISRTLIYSAVRIFGGYNRKETHTIAARTEDGQGHVWVQKGCEEIHYRERRSE